MFAIIYDPYGNIYNAEVVSKGHKTREEATEKMREFVTADYYAENNIYFDDDETLDSYFAESDFKNGYAFTPRGYMDAAYKVIEI